MVDDIGGRELVDGRTTVAVTAHDVWLNVDLSLGQDTIIDDAIPFETLWTKACMARLESVEAFDHPQDDGSAIDVVFAPSAVDDFGHYLVWTFTESITNVSAWHADGMLSDGVGAARIDTQRIDADGSSWSPERGHAAQSRRHLVHGAHPEQHDRVRCGHRSRPPRSVHLDGLTTDSAVAIDNVADREAPDRIEEIVANDRPEDDGRAVLLEFLPSTASDVESYEVYVLSAPFNRVSEDAFQAWCSITPTPHRGGPLFGRQFP